MRPSDLVHARRGHFTLESGHHGDLWLDLELLFVRPRRVAPFAAQLARGLPGIDAVCGPLLRGALVAQMVAAELGAQPVALGALIVLGDAATQLAAREGLALERVEALPNTLWEPDDCPLCAASLPLSAR